ncbi:unnamed protein product [Vitrella brassicaformis CCMP3155]|uniref:Uncharacterized protein n=4 Tax=Vitrella brassicaformis TaxID=1169539 RepID=A0A0G4EL68_VITBC|nr:unnamed protein product [Vitrella brassicaformis CCMP3155]|eukprot:CEL97697.1 unnamed protein product [Vitrella brassicaformis CCMP3155]
MSASRKLFLAARRGDLVKVAEAIEEHGISVNVTDAASWTPLMCAAANGKVAVVKYILSRKPRLNAMNQFRWTALHLAASHNKDDVVGLLAAAGCNIHAQDQDGHTPLHAAASGGHVESARALLKAGANAFASNKHGETPGDIARQFERTEVAQLLESWKPESGVEDVQWETSETLTRSWSTESSSRSTPAREGESCVVYSYSPRDNCWYFKRDKRKLRTWRERSVTDLATGLVSFPATLSMASPSTARPSSQPPSSDMTRDKTMRPPPDGVIDGRADGGLHMDVKQAQLHPPTLPQPKTGSQQKERVCTARYNPSWRLRDLMDFVSWSSSVSWWLQSFSDACSHRPQPLYHPDCCLVLLIDRIPKAGTVSGGAPQPPPPPHPPEHQRPHTHPPQQPEPQPQPQPPSCAFQPGKGRVPMQAAAAGTDAQPLESSPDVHPLHAYGQEAVKDPSLWFVLDSFASFDLMPDLPAVAPAVAGGGGGGHKVPCGAHERGYVGPSVSTLSHQPPTPSVATPSLPVSQPWGSGRDRETDMFLGSFLRQRQPHQFAFRTEHKEAFVCFQHFLYDRSDGQVVISRYAHAVFMNTHGYVAEVSDKNTQLRRSLSSDDLLSAPPSVCPSPIIKPIPGGVSSLDALFLEVEPDTPRLKEGVSGVSSDHPHQQTPSFPPVPRPGPPGHPQLDEAASPLHLADVLSPDANRDDPNTYARKCSISSDVRRHAEVILNFTRTHVCGRLCRELNLPALFHHDSGDPEATFAVMEAALNRKSFDLTTGPAAAEESRDHNGSTQDTSRQQQQGQQQHTSRGHNHGTGCKPFPSPAGRGHHKRKCSIQ